MLFKIVLKSFLVGIGGSCMVGPIFLLILNRALMFGFPAGFYSGLGVAFSDGILFALGFAGTISIAAHCNMLAKALEFIGAFVLIVVGVRTIAGILKTYRTDKFWVNPESSCEGEEDLIQPRRQEPGKKSTLELFWMGFGLFLLNVTNPMILVFFATLAARVFPELLGEQVTLLYAFCAGLGTFAGSAAVFTACSFFASFISKIFVPRVKLFLEALTAVSFIGMGFYLLKNLTYLSFFNNLLPVWLR